jgi:hypothetical protein
MATYCRSHSAFVLQTKKDGNNMPPFSLIFYFSLFIFAGCIVGFMLLFVRLDLEGSVALLGAFS